MTTKPTDVGGFNSRSSFTGLLPLMNNNFFEKQSLVSDKKPLDS